MSGVFAAVFATFSGRAWADHSPSPYHLEFAGYGDFRAALYDHGADPTLPGGSAPDRRLELDQSALVLELEAELPERGLTLEAEIEFEHGGTGASMELEYEEFGEYEAEVEKGGEVVVEELYVEQAWGRHFSLRAGRFYVALGLVAGFPRPTDYDATTLAESESTIIPAIWDEMGVEAQYRSRWLTVTLQLVNGLDSTGFSSQRWIASGHQRRFETIRANDPAVVGRVEARALPGVVFGGAVYHAASTTGNRPKGDLNDVEAPLTLVSGHWRADVAPVRVAASVVWGRLGEAAVITDANRRLSNNLDVLRSPVANEALAAWVELGFDLLHSTALGREHRLGPHVRAERYDTMFRVEGDLFDNPRFERTVLTGGAHYALREALVVKLDAAHRRFGAAALRPETTGRLGIGFVF